MDSMRYKMDEADMVEYWIYPTDRGKDGLSVLAELWKLVESWVQAYLWHAQPFNLRLVNSADSWHLSGSVMYGESVDDEWMVVSILKQITREFAGLCARVVDSDGEIILIEAADTVPKWAGEPELAEGRVFLYGGEVHLVPVCRTPGTVSPFPCGVPDPGAAARYIAGYPDLTRASQQTQKCIDERLGGMPLDVSNNHHTTTLVIPDILAALLHNNKQAVSDLAQALRDQDHLDQRKTRAMPCIRQVKTGSYAVEFPKCLYALISSINVRPHRSSGWVINEKEKAEVLGFKLSLGLETILSRYRQSDSASESGTDWTNFSAKLASVGYFQGEMEGSIKYKELIAKAKDFWSSSSSTSTYSSLDGLVDLVTRYERGEVSPPQAGWLRPGGRADDEAWMEVTPESLDKMLAARFGVAEGGSSRIPGQLDAFLNNISDMAGIGDKDDVDFNPNQLIDSMKKLLGEEGNLGGEANLDTDEFSSDSEEEDDDEDPIIIDYMDRLDAEVGGEVKGRQDLPDQDKPLDIDASVLSNLLSSYSAEVGFSGPASSLFNTLGVNPGVKEDS